MKLYSMKLNCLLLSYWKMMNSYRGKESVLNFSKPDKSCSIKITENWLATTYVEIRVGPVGEKKM